MILKDTATFRVLSNVLNRTFGKMSGVKDSTHFIQLSMPDDQHLTVNFLMRVRFGHESLQLELMRHYRDEGLRYVQKALEKVSKEYQEDIKQKGRLLEPKKEPYEDPPKETIKLTLLDHSVAESVEITNTSMFSPVKDAFYRLKAYIEVK